MLISPFSKMIEAIGAVDCEKISAIMNSELDVNARTEGDEWNCLHLAASVVIGPTHPEVVQHLISLGVDVNARDYGLWTPLHFAVRTQNAEVVRLLLDAGAEVDAINDEGLSPLHLCITSPGTNIEIVQMLLASGADHENKHGRGTLRRFMDVVARPDKEAIIALLDKYSQSE